MVQVIDNVRFMQRRLEALERRRSDVSRSIETADVLLPDWALAPLKSLGLTDRELEDARQAQGSASVRRMQDELDEIDREVEQIEAQLHVHKAESLDGVLELASICAARLRHTTPTDPRDPFYDHGDAKTLQLIENVVANLERFAARVEVRRAG